MLTRVVVGLLHRPADLDDAAVIADLELGMEVGVGQGSYLLRSCGVLDRAEHRVRCARRWRPAWTLPTAPLPCARRRRAHRTMPDTPRSRLHWRTARPRASNAASPRPISQSVPAASSTASRASRSASAALPRDASARARTVRQITCAQTSSWIAKRSPTRLSSKASSARPCSSTARASSVAISESWARSPIASSRSKPSRRRRSARTGVALEQRGLGLAVGRGGVDRLAHLVEQPVALLEDRARALELAVHRVQQPERAHHEGLPERVALRLLAQPLAALDRLGTGSGPSWSDDATQASMSGSAHSRLPAPRVRGGALPGLAGLLAASCEPVAERARVLDAAHAELVAGARERAGGACGQRPGCARAPGRDRPAARPAGAARRRARGRARGLPRARLPRRRRAPRSDSSSRPAVSSAAPSSTSASTCSTEPAGCIAAACPNSATAAGTALRAIAASAAGIRWAAARRPSSARAAGVVAELARVAPGLAEVVAEHRVGARDRAARASRRSAGAAARGAPSARAS